MKVIVIGGFLGSGKTSVILQLARHLTKDAHDDKIRLAIIENEIGEIGVDDQTLQEFGNYTVENMFSGCVCCTLTGNLLESVRKLRDKVNPEYIILEPTGVADSENLANYISGFLDIPSSISCIVDAQRWERVNRAMSLLVSRQISASSVVLINKIDMVDDTALESIKADILEYNPTTTIHPIVATQEIDSSILESLY